MMPMHEHHIDGTLPAFILSAGRQGFASMRVEMLGSFQDLLYRLTSPAQSHCVGVQISKHFADAGSPLAQHHSARIEIRRQARRWESDVLRDQLTLAPSRVHLPCLRCSRTSSRQGSSDIIVLALVMVSSSVYARSIWLNRSESRSSIGSSSRNARPVPPGGAPRVCSPLVPLSIPLPLPSHLLGVTLGASCVLPRDWGFLMWGRVAGVPTTHAARGPSDPSGSPVSVLASDTDMACSAVMPSASFCWYRSSLAAA